MVTPPALPLDGRVVVIGAGPAGLTAARELVRAGHQPVVLEKSRRVGGLARTEEYRGFRFDMGGHRFFTKSARVNRFWREALGDEFLLRPRLSRIYYQGRFFDYPLKPLNALSGLGLRESALILLSYLRWQVFPYRREETFEQWVTNRFGQRLFRTFFQAYTEKVWGISCSELKAEWAAQRIKDLSLKTAVLNMLFKPKAGIKTLIEEFHYPRLGPGMMWEAVSQHIEDGGGSVLMEHEVVRLHRQDDWIESVVVQHGGRERTVRGAAFISSLPLALLVQKLEPAPPDDVLEAARSLSYRDFLTVCLIVNRSKLFPDNWIYVHDPRVAVARIQNFKNWSPDMVPDPTKTSLGMEYFCNEGDDLWSMRDDALIDQARRELGLIGFAEPEEVEDGCVFRVPKAYPVYDSDYADALAILREYVEWLRNLQTIGRNGLHRYNNQDHAMLTGMLAVENLLNGAKHDLWDVNADQEYHEETRESLPAA